MGIRHLIRVLKIGLRIETEGSGNCFYALAGSGEEILPRHWGPGEICVVVTGGAVLKTTHDPCPATREIYLPGDIVGLTRGAVIPGARYVSACDSLLLIVPRSDLAAYVLAHPEFDHALTEILKKSIGHASAMMDLLERGTPAQRAAYFLLSIGARLGDKGHLCKRFELPFSLADIAAYLGLSPEILLDHFDHLARLGLISRNTTSVVINNASGLYDRCAPFGLKIMAGYDIFETGQAFI